MSNACKHMLAGVDVGAEREGYETTVIYYIK